MVPTIPTLTLRDNTEFPAFGLGTWKSGPGEVYAAVRAALEVGYCHLDCAENYQNEEEVGRAIEDAIKVGDITRERLWVTSKLWNDAHLREDVRPALEKTLQKLRLEYLDLYLVHWPIAFQPGVRFPRTASDWLTLKQAPLEATWEAMNEVKAAGLTRQIGVSNMGPERIEKLSAVAEAPAVNQVESHPHLQQRKLLAYLKEREIAMTSYSPLGSMDRAFRRDDEPPLLEHPVIGAIADEAGTTSAQVLIQWALARGTAVIPKSVNPARIAENLASLAVQLSPEHMQQIAALDKGYRYLDGSVFDVADSPYRPEEIWR